MSRKPILLIVEDEPELRELLKLQCESSVYSIEAVEDGAIALRRVLEKANSDKKIDVIVSDINMPNLNGIELLESLRKNRIDIPFIFITAYADKEKAIKALKLGAYDFLEKPYDPDLLLKTLLTAFESLGQFEAMQLSSNDSSNEQLNKLRAVSSALKKKNESQ